MKIEETFIKDILILTPTIHKDNRGYFLESYNEKQLSTHLDVNFVQDNESKSTFGVLRGLHYQMGKFAQAKLVRVAEGTVLDVAVDIREGSSTYGQSYSILLSAENKKQLFIPRGFAHGFVVLSPTATFCYKCDNFYSKESEGGILYNDPSFKIDWQIAEKDMVLSEKDQINPTFGQHKKFYTS